MAQILVRNLDNKLVQRLKRQAARNGRSLQSEAKTIIEQGLKVDMETARKMMDRFRSQFKGRKFPDSAKLIRAERDR